jgi:hypothetical protein
VLGKSGLLLIEVHGQQLEMDRGAALQVAQQREEGEAVLAPAQANHDAIAFDDHVEIGDCLSHTPQEFPFELLFSGLHSMFLMQRKIVA